MAMLKKIKFSIGGFFSTTTTVHVRNKGGKLKGKSNQMPPSGQDLHCVLELSGEAWQAWLLEFEALDIENWEDEYVDPHVLDGTQWSLKCKWKDGKQKRIGGSNAYPEQWRSLLHLLGQFEPSLLTEMETDDDETDKTPTNKIMYASVVFGSGGKAYHYISDDPSLKIGDRCIVPTGPGNDETIAEVVAIEYCTETDAPYPPGRTKHILRKYIAVHEEGAEESEDMQEDLDEMQALIDREEWSDLLDWAREHHDDQRPGMGLKVLDAYELCSKAGLDDYGDIALDIGALYYSGLSVPQDYAKAMEYYEQSARMGNLRALGNLGYCYYYGRSVPQDYAKAYHYFILGVLLGNDPNCLYKLGDMYLNGYHVAANEDYAFQLYQRAWDANKEYGDFFTPDIYFRLGKCYLQGIGTKCDKDEAHSYLSRALDGFYRRRKEDPFVGKLISSCEKILRDLEQDMQHEIVGYRH